MPVEKKPKGPANAKARLNLVDVTDDQRPTELVVHALDLKGEVLQSAPVDDSGEFQLSNKTLDRATFIKIGPADEDPKRSKKLKTFRGPEFAAMVQNRAVVDIAEAAWRHWFHVTLCVSGSVRRCWPFWPVVGDMVRRQAFVGPLRSVESISSRTLQEFRRNELIPFVAEALQPRLFGPWCSPICNGVVEVYRRRCCCHPIVVFDPRIDRILEWLEEHVRPPFPPIPDPGPLVDEPPFEVLERVLTGGAEDPLKINAARDLMALKALPAAEQVQYIDARPYLLWPICHCATPVKVGEGFIDDGDFEICWTEPLRIMFPWCTERYAYVVKQNIDGATTTIYDGLSAGNWFGRSEHAELTTYLTDAIACRPPGGIDVEGAYVYLQDIGLTPTHRLATPPQISPESVGPLEYNSGLLNPAASAVSAVGTLTDQNLGGTLRLRYHFSEPLRLAGGHFYRVSVAEDDGSGAPTGTWTSLAPGEWRYTEWTGATLIGHKKSLGPHTAGGEANLYEIPYDDALPFNEEWQDGQYHAYLDTTKFQNKRHLLRVEVFDNAGQRLRPTGSTGAGTDADFNYFRWLAETGPGSYDLVDYASLTHMLWWDNRSALALIRDVEVGGVAGSVECQFHAGTANDQVVVEYHAYHPNEMFLYRYSLKLRRGIGGQQWQVANDGEHNAGYPYPGLAHDSVAKKLSDLLEIPPLQPSKCSFSIVLNVYVKTTNGIGRLSGLDRHDFGSFAAELTGP